MHGVASILGPEEQKEMLFEVHDLRISLVVQGLRISCQCRGHRFNPWSEKIPQAAEQLSPCATTTEPVGCTAEACTAGARAAQRKKATAMRSPGTVLESSPHSPQLEKAHTQQQRARYKDQK